MSLKDEIAAGPKFAYEDDVVSRACGACAAVDFIDRDTGLCRPCWRAWRFGGGYETPAWKGLNKRLESLEGHDD